MIETPQRESPLTIPACQALCIWRNFECHADPRVVRSSSQMSSRNPAHHAALQRVARQQTLGFLDRNSDFHVPTSLLCDTIAEELDEPLRPHLSRTSSMASVRLSGQDFLVHVAGKDLDSLTIRNILLSQHQSPFPYDPGYTVQVTNASPIRHVHTFGRGHYGANPNIVASSGGEVFFYQVIDPFSSTADNNLSFPILEPKGKWQIPTEIIDVAPNSPTVSWSQWLCLTRQDRIYSLSPSRGMIQEGTAPPGTANIDRPGCLMQTLHPRVATCSAHSIVHSYDLRSRQSTVLFDVNTPVLGLTQHLTQPDMFFLATHRQVSLYDRRFTRIALAVKDHEVASSVQHVHLQQHVVDMPSLSSLDLLLHRTAGVSPTYNPVHLHSISGPSPHHHSSNGSGMHSRQRMLRGALSSHALSDHHVDWQMRHVSVPDPTLPCLGATVWSSSSSISLSRDYSTVLFHQNAYGDLFAQHWRCGGIDVTTTDDDKESVVAKADKGIVQSSQDNMDSSGDSDNDSDDSSMNNMSFHHRSQLMRQSQISTIHQVLSTQQQQQQQQLRQQQQHAEARLHADGTALRKLFHRLRRQHNKHNSSSSNSIEVWAKRHPLLYQICSLWHMLWRGSARHPVPRTSSSSSHPMHMHMHAGLRLPRCLNTRDFIHVSTPDACAYTPSVSSYRPMLSEDALRRFDVIRINLHDVYITKRGKKHHPTNRSTYHSQTNTDTEDTDAAVTSHAYDDVDRHIQRVLQAWPQAERRTLWEVWHAVYNDEHMPFPQVDPSGVDCLSPSALHDKLVHMSPTINMHVIPARMALSEAQQCAAFSTGLMFSPHNNNNDDEYVEYGSIESFFACACWSQRRQYVDLDVYSQGLPECRMQSCPLPHMIVYSHSHHQQQITSNTHTNSKKHAQAHASSASASALLSGSSQQSNMHVDSQQQMPSLSQLIFSLSPTAPPAAPPVAPPIVPPPVKTSAINNTNSADDTMIEDDIENASFSATLHTDVTAFMIEDLDALWEQQTSHAYAVDIHHDGSRYHDDHDDDR